MKVAMPFHQRGLSFGSFIVGAFLFVLLAVTGIKLIPAYMQNEKIKHVFAAIAHDPEMQKASAYEIRAAFEKRGAIDDVTAIQASDIQISIGNGAPYLAARYAIKIPLVANISLYLEFNPSSAK